MRPVSSKGAFLLRGMALAALLLLGGGLCFGFEFDLGGEGGGLRSPFDTLSIGGDLWVQGRFFFDDFDSSAPAEKVWESNKVRDLAAGKLKISLLGEYADVVANLKLAPLALVFDDSDWPRDILDEAYLRLYFGSLQVEGGVRKLTWGKADSVGPLDVVNPLDYRDLTRLSNQNDRKIGRPLLHLSWYAGDLSKLEAVFVPTFQGHEFAGQGRWAPRQVSALGTGLRTALMGMIQSPPFLSTIDQEFLSQIVTHYAEYASRSPDSFYPSTGSIDYAQGGLRFITTLGSVDLGAQYFYGNLFRPALTVKGLEKFYQEPLGVEVKADYNRYHQIGLDYAQVLGGFNLRAEAAANITTDLEGTDGSVYNPFLGWSLGFDRDLLWGINLNLQGTGTIILMHDKIGDNPLTDTEAGKNPSSSRIIALLTKKFVRDTLEIRALGFWGIEDRDGLINPSLVWMPLDELSLELVGGLFLGNQEGELGQYHRNNFVKFQVTYSL